MRVEQRQRTEPIYRQVIKNQWGGNCAGMCATLALLYTDIGVTPGDFEKAIVFLLSVNSINKNSVEHYTVKSFIEAMQIAQYYDMGVNGGVWTSRSGDAISYVTYDTLEYIWENRGMETLRSELLICRRRFLIKFCRFPLYCFQRLIASDYHRSGRWLYGYSNFYRLFHGRISGRAENTARTNQRSESAV